MRLVVVLMLSMLLMMLAVHCTWVTSNAYSSPSVVLANYNNDGTKVILDDFREAYYWLWQNTHPDARVMSWCAANKNWFFLVIHGQTQLNRSADLMLG